MCIFTIFFHKFLLYSLNLIMVWNILKYRASFYLVKMHLFDIKLTILYTFSNQRHLKILICVINHIWAQKFMRGPISIIGGKDRQINRWGEDLNYRPPWPFDNFVRVLWKGRWWVFFIWGVPWFEVLWEEFKCSQFYTYFLMEDI